MTLSYDDPDVEGYIDSKGWAILKRERGKSGEHIVLKVCPCCGKVAKRRNDRNFYINVQSGLWNTYCCDKTGNMLTLKREQGDLDLESIGTRAGTSEGAKLADKLKRARGRNWQGFEVPPMGTAEYFHRRLMNKEVPNAYEHITAGRGLTDASLERFKIGVAMRGRCHTCEDNVCPRPPKEGVADHPECPKCGGVVNNTFEAISIPYFVNGREVNFKFRSFEGDKRFERWTGAPTVLFNEDALAGEFKRVVIAEAELDAITLTQVGFDPVVSPAGAKKSMEDDWLERLALFDDVLLAYDNDEAGDEGADKAASELGRYRCRRVKLPMKDANDCLRSGMPGDELRSYVEQAAEYAISAVKPASDYVDDVRKMREQGPQIRGRQTQWLGFNKLLGGLRDGEITVVTGDTGSGKTTWTTALAWDIARGDQDRDAAGVLFASFEEPIKNVVRKIFCMETRKPFVGDDALDDDDFEATASTIGNTDLFFVDQYGEMPLPDLRDAIEYGVRRYGLWLVVLDHLHFFLPPSNDERRTIDDAVRNIKKWAVRLGVHIMLVVHPSKLRVDHEGNPLKVELNDLKGSSAIKQDADNVIRVWRERNENRSSDVPPYAEITSLKCRSDFGTESAIALSFDPPSMRYTFTGGMTTGGGKGNGKGKGKGKGKKSKPKQQALIDEPPPMPTQSVDDDDDGGKPRTLYIGGSPYQPGTPMTMGGDSDD